MGSMPRFLLVSGDNGVGKAALLDYLYDACRENGGSALLFSSAELHDVVPMMEPKYELMMVLLDHVTDTLHHTRQLGLWRIGGADCCRVCGRLRSSS